MAVNDQLAAMFREEAAEHLATLESALLELERRPQDADLIAQTFRALHTIKGSGAMAGFDRIAAIAHEVESVFAQIRMGKLRATPEVIALTLETKDLIRAMLDPTAPVSPESRERLRLGFQVILDRAAGTEESPAASGEPKLESADRSTTSGVQIAFTPHRDFFQNGSNPIGILAELATMGNCQTVTHVDAVPLLQDLEPEDCHLRFEVRLQTSRSISEIRDVFMFVEDRCELAIAVSTQAASCADARAASASSSTLMAVAAADGRVDSPPATSRESVSSKRSPDNASSIRVSADKLDNLVDLVGELVIAQARLAQLASTRADDQLFSVAEDLGRLSAELRDSTLDIRMVPIGTTFVRFKRLVRDLATELGKEIQLETEGADTELDKTMIERLFDPLVHLIRNSCDHGIESPDARRQAGKTAAGTVRLVAYHSGQNVLLEIKDDGAGLDPGTIRRRAIDLGLLDENAQLSSDELYKLIFLPGFSTTKAVTKVSGRGVGMDVVKRSVEALRGQIDIVSRHGKGTTIRLQLPLTLAIIEGLLVDVGAGRFVLPMAMVEECVELTAQDIEDSHGNRLANVRGEMIPYIRLREWFGSAGLRPAIEQIAITTVEGKRFGFVVDSVVGQHQTVIKSLGRMYQHTRGLSGATILGDGNLALIVDVPALLRTVQQAA